MGKSSRKTKVKKIIVPKTRLDTTLAHKIRKQKKDLVDRDIERITESAVNYVKGMMANHVPFLAFYTIPETATMMGLDRHTLQKLIQEGVVPPGEKAPSGYMFYIPSQVKLLDMAAKRYIVRYDSGVCRVNKEALKQFLAKWWVNNVYDLRKGKWFVRRSSDDHEESFWAVE